MKRISLLVLACLVGLSGVACGASPSVAPTSPDPSTTPSASPSEAAAPSPTPSPSPSPNLHGVPELEARLPDTIGGTPLSKVSLTGPEFMAGGDSTSQGQLLDMLDDLQRTEGDLSVAEAYDPTGALVFQEGLFRVSGADPVQLLAAWVAAQQAAKRNLLEVTNETIGGRMVTVLTDPNSPVGGHTYAFADGDTIVLVLADDRALVEEAISLI